MTTHKAILYDSAEENINNMNSNGNTGSSRSKYDSLWRERIKVIKKGLLAQKLDLDVANDFRRKTKRKDGFKLIYSNGRIKNTVNHAARCSLISAIESDQEIKELLHRIDNVVIELSDQFRLLIYRESY